MPIRILVIHGAATPHVLEAIRRAYPRAALTETEESDMRRLEGAFEAVVIRCDDNAGFGRVRLIRHYLPRAGIVVISDRDRPSSAYMAGANAFAVHYDTDQLVQALKETLASSGGDGEAVPPGDLSSTAA